MLIAGLQQTLRLHRFENWSADDAAVTEAPNEKCFVNQLM